MKAFQKIVTSLFVLFSICTVSAQYGNGYENNGYENNRMSKIGQESEPENEKAIPVEITVSKIIKKMTPEINLDELQVIAISNVLKESLDKQGRILKQDTNQEEQIKDLQILTEITDRKILGFLNKEQKEKYLIFKEEIKNPKKSKPKGKQK